MIHFTLRWCKKEASLFQKKKRGKEVSCIHVQTTSADLFDLRMRTFCAQFLLFSSIACIAFWMFVFFG